MQNRGKDGAVTVIKNQPATTGAWFDMQTWRDTDGTEWVIEPVCADFYARAYFGDAPPPDVRWYELQRVRVKVTTADEKTWIPGKIRTKVVQTQRPFPYQFRPWVYHKKDVIGFLKEIDRTSLVDGTWNKLGGDCWTSKDGQAWGTNSLINGIRRSPNETRHADSVMWPTDLRDHGVEVKNYSTRKVAGKVRFLDLDWPCGIRPRCKVYNLEDAADFKEWLAQQNKKRYERLAAKKKNAIRQGKRKQDDKGNWWFAPGYSLEYLNQFFLVSQPTMSRWSGEGGKCVYLPDGRGIRLKQFPFGDGRFVDYLSKDDLDGIRDTRKKLLDGDGATVSYTEAVRRLVKIGCTKHEAQQILRKTPTVTALGQRKDNRPLTQDRYRRKTIAKLIMKMRKYHANPTVAAAARELETSPSTLGVLIERGHLDIVPDPLGRNRERRQRIDRNQFMALKEERLSQDITVTDRGTWLPFSVAQRRYPNATFKVLYGYANKGSPQLRGEILHAEYFHQERLLPRQGKRGCLKWLEADLKRLEPGKVGMAGQKAARLAREKAEQAATQPACVPDVAKIVGHISAMHQGLQNAIHGVQKTVTKVGKETTKSTVAALGARADVSDGKRDMQHNEMVGTIKEVDSKAVDRHRQMQGLFDAFMDDQGDMPMSKPMKPKDWCDIFSLSWDSLRVKFESQAIRNKKLSDRSYCVAIVDIPENHRSKFTGK